MKLVFASNNKHKLEEAKIISNGKFEILSLNDINFHEEIPEDYNTLSENALQKANYIYDRFHINCFADDTGLSIEALNGEPGVFSARYAGNNCSYEDNMNKVLEKMKGIDNRKASFSTIIALILNGEKYLFEGKIEGEIALAPRGSNGFGYDPIFVPKNYSKSFAELSDVEKNSMSHRYLALQKLFIFLESIKNNKL